MCGIVGVFALNKTDLQIDQNLRRKLALFLHNEILFETIARGKDATGISVSFGESENPNAGASSLWQVLKQPVDTEDFFLNDGSQARYNGQEDEANIERFMDVSTGVQRPLQHIIGHTRAKTVGTEFNPNNNHPLLVGKIIGIHNGGVKNYKKIYGMHKEMTPQGDVDSEIIMQLLAENANDRALDVEDIKYVTERIVGPRSVLAYNRDFPEKVIYFHDKERPLEMAYIEELGLAIICSERRFFHTAMHVYQRASLTLKRSLPELTVQWRNVPRDKGGVIDISEEFSGDCNPDDMFPLIDCSDVLSDYDTSIVTHHGGYNANKKNKVYGGHNNHNQSIKNKAKDNTTNKNIPVAKVIDITSHGYGADVDATANTNKPDTKVVKSVVAKVIVDDSSDEAEESDTAVDMYNTAGLRKKGIEYVLSASGQKDSTLLVNKHAGAYSKLLCKPMPEQDAAELIGQIYPESFGEGYGVGYKDGVDDQVGLQSDSALIDITDKLDDLEIQNNKLKAELKEKESQADKASAYIANMKAFLMASIITNDLGRVEGTGTSQALVFDDDLEQFLGTTEGYAKANPELVRELFNARDLKNISDSLVSLARKVKQEATATTPKLTTVKS